MPELGALQEAEMKSRKVIEQAMKEAQKTRLEIRDRLEAMDAEKDQRLAEVAGNAEEAVDAEIEDIAAQLESTSEERLKALDTRRAELEERATAMLREEIKGGAKGD